jgi:hypothetical protein
MIIFLHIPKTAGSTFQFILENSFGVSACHTNHNKKPVFTQADFNFARRIFPRLRSLAGHNPINPLSLSVPHPFYITFLREPIVRVVSQYLDSVTNGSNRTFEQSLRTLENYENIHVKLMAGERNLDKAKFFLEKCSFVGLTEKFDLSLHVLKQLCPYKLNYNYKRRRVTPPNPNKKKLENDTRMMEMALEYNKLDVELYSFAINEVFPKMCAKAGFKPSDKVASYERYTSDFHLKFLMCNLYNMMFYRQLCKMRK